MKSLLRFWHTVRHLRREQVVGRVRHHLYVPRVDRSPAPPVRPRPAGWVGCARAASLVGPRTFTFLSDTRALGSSWNEPSWPKLWLYNLHYFDDLVADDAGSRAAWHRALLAEWIASNPGPDGNGWEPYPISLRVVNWIKWLWAGNEPVPGMLDSLAAQVRFLMRRLEFHLLGNHLWANAKALAFAGSYFGGAEGDAWLARGLSLLDRERVEQILPDGGHFERSPMYHAIVLEDVLDLSQVFPADPFWRDAAVRMLHWLRVMSHTDGGISFFNDAAFDIAPDLAALGAYATALGVDVPSSPLGEVEVLPDSGYVRLARGPAVVIMDIGAVGPDYIPGHAHAGTLSFELSLSGRRVLVNGGTSTYERGAQRDRERGTAMHNTVVIDGLDSSEVWSGFRVGRRAEVRDVSWEAGAEHLLVIGTLTGYGGRKLTHIREVRLRAEALLVTDFVMGRFQTAEARFRMLAPIAWSAPEGRVEDGTWHPRFGASEPCEVLVVPVPMTTEFRW